MADRSWRVSAYVRPGSLPRARWRWRSFSVVAPTAEQAHAEAQLELRGDWIESVSVMEAGNG
jgi:hypothetical protein